MKQGIIAGLGLVLVGLALQVVVGPIDWSLMNWPVNAIVLALLAVIAVMLHVGMRWFKPLQSLSSGKMAVAALLWTAAMTLVMGLTRQSGSPAAHHTLGQLLGIHHCLSWWPFVLIYVWLTMVLALVVLRRLGRFSTRRDIPFLLSHAGMLVVLMCATLGNADLQRLQMTVTYDQPEWRATDESGQVHELPVAIELLDFTINEYPPKLLVIDTGSGQPLPVGNPEVLLLDSAFTASTLQGHTVRLVQVLDKAQPVMSEDTTAYEPWHMTGATTAVLVDVDGQHHWLSTGSYMFPPQTLQLNDRQSLAVPPREPQRYVSTVEIMTESGKHLKTDILVNRPVTVDGWKIYQLNYDTRMGRWSDISVLELVRDPWLPAVYTGIVMMLVGAVLMLFTSQPRKEGAAQ